MSDVAETKPDPAIAAPEETKPETTTGEGEKSTTEAAVETATETAEQAADAAKDAAVKTSDSVFSMFGGGPKKEKKEETDEPTDEPSGSSKAQKADDEVSWIRLVRAILAVVGWTRARWKRGLRDPYIQIVGSSQPRHFMPDSD